VIEDADTEQALDKARARVIEKEKQVMANLSEKDRLYYEANRLAITKSTEEYFKDKNAWWNKITAMNEE